MKVVVFGSINMDLVVNAPQLPGPGQTITGDAYYSVPGGKGANQAVAASRLGAQTIMIGRVGVDAFGGALLDNLRANRVDVSGVQQDGQASSGVALIIVGQQGENQIVVVRGANGRVSPEDAQKLSDVIEPGDVALLQLEVPLEATLEAASVAQHAGATVLLDPAPARQLPAELLSRVDILTPNENEAGVITGIHVIDRKSAEKAARRLHELGARQVLIKQGANGALWSAIERIRSLRPFVVKAIDTVAAGDACSGAIAAALCAGLAIEEALKWGMAAGALATTRKGAQDAMPDRDALLALLIDQPGGGQFLQGE